MLKGTKLYSIIMLKCPQCHKGDLFLTKNPYDFRNIDKMPDKCSMCEKKYWPEPGFYYGAMYISYALTIAISVAVFLIMTIFDVFTIVWYLGINTSLILILFPPIFRFSRAIWFNIFAKYEPNDKK